MKTQILAMTATLAHRGPDDDGIWCDPESGVALGFRRLAIIDVSPLGHQPMTSRTGRFVIIFNGEIYNHLELRRMLLGVGWRGGSDTETLLACIEQWGIYAALERAVGMFALAVWDTKDRVLFLARDRFGEKPLYYGRLPSGDFVFGSELKALKAHACWAGAIDRTSLSTFMQFAAVPDPLSIYEGISKLRPSHVLEVKEDRSATCNQYWSVNGREDGGDAIAGGPESANIDRLDELLTHSVQQQMVADVPIGAFLSGGIDSSTIVALMCKAGPANVRTFSVGFEELGFDEAPHARRVAEHLGTIHSEEYVTAKQALDVVPRLPAVYDEPFADSSQIPTFLLCGSARREVTVALTGDGADELFAGYDRYRIAATIWPLVSRVPLPVREILGTIIRGIPAGISGHLVKPVNLALPSLGLNADRLQKFSESVLVAPTAEALYLSLLSSWSNPEEIVVGHEPPLRPVVGQHFSNTALVDAMCRLDMENYLPNDILVKVDRAAMAVSLETRAPFLDHRVVQFSRGLPLNQRVRDGQRKWILRQVLERYVPRRLIERPKQGFSVPIGLWLRGALREWAEHLLSDRKLTEEGLLDPGPIRQKWREHLAGKHNWQLPLWTVLMFQAWREHEKAS
jgi:asparagine synthase (glutamine-hydrolysing)